MKELDSINTFFTQAMGIVNQIRSYGETLGDQQVVEKIQVEVYQISLIQEL